MRGETVGATARDKEMEGVATDDKENYDDMISNVDDDDRGYRNIVFSKKNGDSNNKDFGETATKKARTGGGGSKREEAVKDKNRGGYLMRKHMCYHPSTHCLLSLHHDNGPIIVIIPNRHCFVY